jgi:hypothetical protein
MDEVIRSAVKILVDIQRKEREVRNPELATIMMMLEDYRRTNIHRTSLMMAG